MIPFKIMYNMSMLQMNGGGGGGERGRPEPPSFRIL